MKRLLLAIGVAVSAFASCTTTSAGFVEGRLDVSVIRGRIHQVDNLSGGNIRRFADGIAVTVKRPGCVVTVTLGKSQTKRVELGPGAILVYGTETDYVLRHVPSVPSH